MQFLNFSNTQARERGFSVTLIDVVTLGPADLIGYVVIALDIAANNKDAILYRIARTKSWRSVKANAGH